MSPRCGEHGCRTLAAFGYPGGPRTRCDTHRLAGMVGMLQSCPAAPLVANLWLRQDMARVARFTSSVMQENIVAPICEEDGCKRNATFCYPGGPHVRCGMHRLNGMVGDCAAVQCALRVSLFEAVHRQGVSQQCLCGFAGEPLQAHMPTGWLPQVREFWLPRGQPSAMCHAQTGEHGGNAAAMPCNAQSTTLDCAEARCMLYAHTALLCRRMSSTSDARTVAANDAPASASRTAGARAAACTGLQAWCALFPL